MLAGRLDQVAPNSGKVTLGDLKYPVWEGGGVNDPSFMEYLCAWVGTTCSLGLLPPVLGLAGRPHVALPCPNMHGASIATHIMKSRLLVEVAR